MKKKSVAILVVVILTFFIIVSQIYISKIYHVRKQSKLMLQQAYEIVDSKNEKEKQEEQEEYEEYKEHEKQEEQEDKEQEGHGEQEGHEEQEEQNANDYITEKEKIISEDGMIGVLIIPKINIEAPIKEGTSQSVMHTCVGHFVESDYWNGNVSLASHNSGTSAHYFEKLNTLNENDTIQYITKLGIKNYKVTTIKKIESTDWSMVTKIYNKNENKKNTKNTKNTITLITCINGLPNYRLCVRGEEI